METIAQEARVIFEQINPKNWCVKYLRDGPRKCCALGHWNRIHNGGNYIASAWSKREDDLLLAVDKYAESIKKDFDLDSVNDDPTKLYPQKTPKERVLALMDDMIKAGF